LFAPIYGANHAPSQFIAATGGDNARCGTEKNLPPWLRLLSHQENFANGEQKNVRSQ
jgi:hypothetical protein